MQPLRRFKRPHCALPIMQTAKVLGQTPPIDHALPVPFHDIYGSVGAFSAASGARAPVGVDEDGFWFVEERLECAFESVQSCGDFGGHEGGVDVIQPLHQLQKSIVPRDAHGFVDFGLVLLVGFPGHAGRVGGGDLGEQLVFAEEGGEGEQVVGVAGCGGEVAGGGGEDAYSAEEEGVGVATAATG